MGSSLAGIPTRSHDPSNELDNLGGEINNFLTSPYRTAFIPIEDVAETLGASGIVNGVPQVEVYGRRMTEEEKIASFMADLSQQALDFTINVAPEDKPTAPQIVPPTIAPLNSTPPQPPVFLRGKLSEKYETGGRGPGVVSSGKGDPGGVSYGSYQFSSKRGVVNEFLKANGTKWQENFVNLNPTIPDGEFAKNWKEIAKREPKPFFFAQHTYVERNYYDTQAKLISKKTGLDINARSRAVQDAVWSTAVQQGQFSSAVVNAVKALNGIDRSSADFDARLINAIYDERSKLDKNGNLVYFKNSSLDVQAGIKLRYVNERRDALEMLRNSQSQR